MTLGGEVKILYVNMPLNAQYETFYSQCILKRESCLHIIQVSLGYAIYKSWTLSSLKVSFKIELDPLDFNIVVVQIFYYIEMQGLKSPMWNFFSTVVTSLMIEY